MSTDAIEELKNPPLPDDTPTTANERYEEKSLGTWSSISDVDTFLSRFTHAKDYKDSDVELALGNYVAINDGTYNAVWMIAGFDMEYNKTAADGTIYNNGLGICMIPQTQITTNKWQSADDITDGYKASYMHTTVLPIIVNKLKNVLGSHIVQRNVLLSSNTYGNTSNGYTWTTAYATLMSAGQITGTFAANRNQYDDGEANYKLPIFNYKEYKTGFIFFLRGVWGYYSGHHCAWSVGSTGDINLAGVSVEYGVRPLIYLR